MRVLLLLDGEPPTRVQFDGYSAQSDYIICADGAYNWAYGYGCAPDLLVGDMDSIKPGHLQALLSTSCEIVRLPSEKDPTDAQVCLDRALEMGARSITILGGGSLERLDHTLGNIQLLLRGQTRGVDTRMCTPHMEVYAQQGERTYQAPVGSLFSLVPWGQDVIVTLKGLQYPLYEHDFKMDIPLGISNVFIEPEAFVEVRGGWALIFIHLQA